MKINEAAQRVLSKIRALIAGLYDSRFAVKMYSELDAIENDETTELTNSNG
jgi:hypothetical protein